ncbi:hypothetical protein Hanom_Chr04g00290701 [Helianthus anomalus]
MQTETHTTGTKLDPSNHPPNPQPPETPSGPPYTSPRSQYTSESHPSQSWTQFSNSRNTGFPQFGIDNHSFSG